MGTSADYTGGTGGNWTPYKHAASTFARHGGIERAEKLLARYVAALGGAARAAATGRNAAVGSAQRVAGFGAGLAADGLTATLERLGLGHLVGRSRYDVLDGLLEALDADGGSREDQAVTQALCETFAELYPEDAVTYEELEAVTLDAGGLVEFIEHFVAWWAYGRMLPTLAEKFTHIEDPDEAQARDEMLRERLGLLVKLELNERDPLAVDWRGADGEQILGHVIDELYDDMEDLG